MYTNNMSHRQKSTVHGDHHDNPVVEFDRSEHIFTRNESSADYQTVASNGNRNLQFQLNDGVVDFAHSYIQGDYQGNVATATTFAFNENIQSIFDLHEIYVDNKKLVNQDQYGIWADIVSRLVDSEEEVTRGAFISNKEPTYASRAIASATATAYSFKPLPKSFLDGVIPLYKMGVLKAVWRINSTPAQVTSTQSGGSVSPISLTNIKLYDEHHSDPSREAQRSGVEWRRHFIDYDHQSETISSGSGAAQFNYFGKHASVKGFIVLMRDNDTLETVTNNGKYSTSIKESLTKVTVKQGGKFLVNTQNVTQNDGQALLNLERCAKWFSPDPKMYWYSNSLFNSTRYLICIPLTKHEDGYGVIDGIDTRNAAAPITVDLTLTASTDAKLDIFAVYDNVVSVKNNVVSVLEA